MGKSIKALGEIAGKGTVTLTGGASGSVDSITVNAIEIMSGAEAFDTDLNTTATNVAANITAFSSVPNYNATASGAVITIEPVKTGNSTYGFAVVSGATTITTSDVNISGDRAQNENWFTNDIIVDKNSKIVISVTEDTGVVAEITKNGGTNYTTLLSGAALNADSEHTFDIHVRPGDLFNIRTPTGGGTTVIWCRIDEIQTEA